jgi:hypothetical protein
VQGDSMKRIAVAVSWTCSFIFIVVLVAFRESKYKEIAIMVALIAWVIGLIAIILFAYKMLKESRKRNE